MLMKTDALVHLAAFVALNGTWQLQCRSRPALAVDRVRTLRSDGGVGWVGFQHLPGPESRGPGITSLSEATHVEPVPQYPPIPRFEERGSGRLVEVQPSALRGRLHSYAALERTRARPPLRVEGR